MTGMLCVHTCSSGDLIFITILHPRIVRNKRLSVYIETFPRGLITRNALFERQPSDDIHTGSLGQLMWHISFSRNNPKSPNRLAYVFLNPISLKAQA